MSVDSKLVCYTTYKYFAHSSEEEIRYLIFVNSGSLEVKLWNLQHLVQLKAGLHCPAVGLMWYEFRPIAIFPAGLLQ